MIPLIKKMYHGLPYKWRVPKTYYNIIGEVERSLHRGDIYGWQLERLKNIVKYVYENVPGYYLLYHDAGVKPSDINCLDDVRLLPFTCKELIRDNIKEFVTKKTPIEMLSYVQTSGSSGVPFGFYKYPMEDWIENAFVGLNWNNGNWTIEQNGIILRGAYTGDEHHIIAKCDNTNFYVHNKSFLISPNYLTQKFYGVYSNFFKEHHEINYIFAFPSSISLLSELMIQNGDVNISSVQSIYLSSENFYDWQKDLIQAAFPQATIISLYGQTERVIMACWRKSDHRYFVDPFYGYTELLDSNNIPVKTGQMGELVGTSFWSFGTPFVRYRTKDYATFDGVSDDLRMILHSIDGRLNEAVVGENGRLVSMTSVANIHDESYKGVERFRIYQDKPGMLVFYLQPNNLFNKDNDCPMIKKSLFSKLGDDFNVSIEIVDKLAPSKSGKYSFLDQRLTINHLDRLSY